MVTPLASKRSFRSSNSLAQNLPLSFVEENVKVVSEKKATPAPSRLSTPVRADSDNKYLQELNEEAKFLERWKKKITEQLSRLQVEEVTLREILEKYNIPIVESEEEDNNEIDNDMDVEHEIDYENMFQSSNINLFQNFHNTQNSHNIHKDEDIQSLLKRLSGKNEPQQEGDEDEGDDLDDLEDLETIANKRNIKRRYEEYEEDEDLDDFGDLRKEEDKDFFAVDQLKRLYAQHGGEEEEFDSD